MTTVDLLAIISSAHSTLCSNALAPPAPMQLSSGDALECGASTASSKVDAVQQTSCAIGLTDVHACEVDGLLVGGRSPRTALLRAPFVAECADVQSDTESREEACAINAAPADDKGQAVYCRVYCEDCKQWFNGPSQYEDHKIGKQRKKKTKRQAAPVERQHIIGAPQPNEISNPQDGALEAPQP